MHDVTLAGGVGCLGWLALIDVSTVHGYLPG